MRPIFPGIGLLWLVAALAASSAAVPPAWQPVPGPLVTRWAQEVSPDRVRPEYPRPQLVREDWLNLNGLWEFQPVAAEAKELLPPTGRPLAERILVPFSVETTLSGVGRREGELWYRRTFLVPRSWRDRRVLLHFGAVDWECQVWVNGKPLGSHQGGYDPFSFDITATLTPSGRQELVLYVFDPTEKGHQPRGKQLSIPNTWFYTPTTGPWQTVWLEPVAPQRIEELVMRPDVDRHRLELTVLTTPEAQGATLAVSALDGGKVVAKKTITIGSEEPAADFTNPSKTTAEPDGLLLALDRENRERTHARLMLELPAPKLWTPQTPNLYDLTFELSRQGRLVDRVRSYFGMRKIQIKSDGQIARIYLNGEAIFLRGVLDQGYWPDGGMTAPTDSALRYDVEILKQMGFTTSRKHIKVEDPRWYYWCDRLGLIVFQDMPGSERYLPSPPGEAKPERLPDQLLFRLDKLPAAEKGEPEKRQFKLELYRMIERLRNHPSVACWTLFNEAYGAAGHDVPALVNAVRRIDPTRLVVDGSGGPFTGESDLIDIHYPSLPARADPLRPVIFSEATGYEQIGMNAHRWDWSSLEPLARDDFLGHVRRLGLPVEHYEHLRRTGQLHGYMFVQLSDLETELNGMLTYDRVPKIQPPDMARLIAPREADQDEVILPTAEAQPVVWRYTLAQPAPDWAAAGFNDAAWKEGESGFGDTKAPPEQMGPYPRAGRFPRTQWTNAEIWLRRSVTVPDTNFAFAYALFQQRGECELFLDGHPVQSFWALDTYYPLELAGTASEVLKRPGPHLLAVHARRQPGRISYVDLGLYGHRRSYVDFVLDPTFQQPFKSLLPPSHTTAGQVWKYTTSTPPDRWWQAGFDDASWSQGKGAFGERPPPGWAFGVPSSYPARYIGTAWTNRELWLRRSFRLDGSVPQKPLLLTHHQGPAEVYLNGRRIYRSDRSLPSYGLFPLDSEAVKAFQRGENTIAVHARKSKEPGFIDLGIVERVKPAATQAKQIVK
jgi:hypothetical protein